MKLNRTLSLALAGALSLSLLSGCGGGNSTGGTDADKNDGSSSTAGSASASVSTPTTEGGVFKIGATGPLTGGAAIYGNAAKGGAEIAVDEINALGGIQFELNYQDDEHDAEKAVNALNVLKDWGVQVTLSSVTSGPGAATSAELFADRIFGLTPSASSTTVTASETTRYDNIFQMCFTDPNQGVASAQYIVDHSLGEKIAVIYNNSDNYSSGVYEAFMDKAAELNLEVVSVTTFTEDSQSDFSVQIADAKNNGADLVYLPIYYTPASLIFQQAASIGYEPIYFGIDGMDGILTMEGFDTSFAEGVMLLTPFNADDTDERVVSFVTEYQNRFGETPNQFAADGYDCVWAIYEAILSSDGAITTDMAAADICEELIAIFTGDFTYNGLTGSNMTWGTDGAVSKDPVGVVIQDGIYVNMD